MVLRVIGIDPSLNNTAVALVQDDLKEPGKLRIFTKHIKRLEPGEYTKSIRLMVDPNNYLGLLTDPGIRIPPGHVTCGFVEDFSNIGGGDTTKTTVKAVSHSGGMAEEAVVAAGIPMQPLTVREWRKWALGQAPKHPTRSGRLVRYWTKGDRKAGVPNNVLPALLNTFKSYMGLAMTAQYDKLYPKDEIPDYDLITDVNVSFDQAIHYAALKNATSRRIQIVFGVSLDELEAAGIALAGYRMIKENAIQGLTYEPGD